MERGHDVTDPLPGDRPRPQYGEYATPEEQAARIRQPMPAPQPVAHPAPEAPGPRSPLTAAPGGSRTPLTAGRILDRAVAVALLAYGLLSLVSAIPATLDPAPLLEMMGLDPGELGVTTTGGWGVAAALVLVVGWIVTALATVLAHRRGWIVFWIPLVGGFVFNAISGILVSVALLADPAVVDAVLRQSGG
jgi:hypothetical protein